MLKIIITGENKSGRSTLAKHLQEYLNEIGMDATIDDEELTMEWHKDNNKRVDLLCNKRTPVEIKVI